MKVGIVEYFNGSAPYLDEELLLEGYAMLKSTVDDFLATGASVSTILDRRLKCGYGLDSVQVIWSSDSSEFERNLASLAQDVDYMLLIAPEYLLPTFLERLGSAESFNSSPDAIRLVSDKCLLAQKLVEAGVEVPESACFEGYDAAVRSFCSDVGYPIAVKPVVGAGCEGLSIVKCEEDLEEALKRAQRSSPNGRVIVQRWCEGLAASVSLIVYEDGILPISLNRQIIKVGAPNQASTYLGGVVPLPHILTERSFEAASKAVSVFRGLKGYVGVDLVLADRPFVLEVNPRITVSYLGLSRVLEGGVARLMVKGSFRSVKHSLRFKGYSSFIKAKLPQSAAELCGTQIIRSPLGGRRCFILEQGDSYDDSLRRLKASINSLQAEVDVEVDGLSP